jgi:hypothetical protein
LFGSALTVRSTTWGSVGVWAVATPLPAISIAANGSENIPRICAICAPEPLSHPLHLYHKAQENTD